MSEESERGEKPRKPSGPRSRGTAGGRPPTGAPRSSEPGKHHFLLSQEEVRNLVIYLLESELLTIDVKAQEVFITRERETEPTRRKRKSTRRKE